MPIKKLGDKPMEPVLIEKIWIEFKVEGVSKSYLVSKEVAEYIEQLENKQGTLESTLKEAKNPSYPNGDPWAGVGD